MSNRKPSVMYRDYTGRNLYKTLPTYAHIKKHMVDYMNESIDSVVDVTRTRRGEWGEWPDENEDEVYYLSLFARKKYCPELIWSNDKTQLKRFTSKKKDVIKKIKQLEVEYGLYDLNGRIVPQESLVIYIHPNPRSQLKAARHLMRKLTDIICDNSKGFNVYQESLSALQKSKSKGYFIDFDIDLKVKENYKIEHIYEYINKNAVTLIETRGGYHVLVEVSKIEEKYKKTFYQELSKYSDVEGDCFIPIPGTIQGGFKVKIIKDE